MTGLSTINQFQLIIRFTYKSSTMQCALYIISKVLNCVLKVWIQSSLAVIITPVPNGVACCLTKLLGKREKCALRGMVGVDLSAELWHTVIVFVLLHWLASGLSSPALWLGAKGNCWSISV